MIFLVKAHVMGLDERTYTCECGYSEDRDIHSARNMLVIKDLVFSKTNLVPAEHREITLTEFKASTGDACGEAGKFGR